MTRSIVMVPAGESEIYVDLRSYMWQLSYLEEELDDLERN